MEYYAAGARRVHADAVDRFAHLCHRAVRLAVTEACSNAAKVHRDDAEDPVVVSCHLDDDRFHVHVHDRGPGFGPDRSPEPEDPQRPRHDRVDGRGSPSSYTVSTSSLAHR